MSGHRGRTLDVYVELVRMQIVKTAGVIGGVGPETTAEFYLEVLFGCYARNKTQRPPMLIWNIPLPYQVEQDLLLHTKGEERYVPYLQEAARLLEKGGADFLVMPCNTLHLFIKEIRSAVQIPVLSILEETGKFLTDSGARRIGILATPALLQKNLYGTILESVGIQQIAPDAFEEAKIGKMINNIVLNRHANKDRDALLRVINHFEQKDVDTVILACTDLQLLIPHHPRLKIYDTMKIFADATVDFILN